MGKKNGNFMSAIENAAAYVNNKVNALNQSKIFAGVMIVILNIASKFVNFKVSKTVESYLKFTFSRHLLVFAATWMGTRDIYVATFMTVLFIFIVDVLFNEKSIFCCLPESFTDQQVAKLEGMATQPTMEEIVKAKIVLENANMNKDRDRDKDKDKDREIFDSHQNPLDIPITNE